MEIIVNKISNTELHNNYTTPENKNLEYRRAELVESVDSMLKYVAWENIKNYSSNDTLTINDLIQTGYIGALVAADRYLTNDTNSAKFSTYAYAYIQKHINEYCIMTQSILTSNLSSSVEVNNIGLVGGDRPIPQLSKENITHFDLISDGLGCDDDIIESEGKEKYEEVFKFLTQIDKEILFMHYGINNRIESSKSEISKKLKIDPKRVSTSIEKSLSKCKDELGDKYCVVIDQLHI